MVLVTELPVKTIAARCEGREIGVTAHLVTMHLDEGPIIAQGSLTVRD